MKINRRTFIKSASITAFLATFGANILLKENNEIPSLLKKPPIFKMNSEYMGIVNGISIEQQREVMDITDYIDSKYKSFTGGMEQSTINVKLASPASAATRLIFKNVPLDIQNFEIKTDDLQYVFKGYLTKIKYETKETELNIIIEGNVECYT